MAGIAPDVDVLVMMLVMMVVMMVVKLVHVMMFHIQLGQVMAIVMVLII